MDTSTPAGTWYLKSWAPYTSPDRGLFLRPIALTVQRAPDGTYGGPVLDDATPTPVSAGRIDAGAWAPAGRLFTFRQVARDGRARWFRARIVEGVLVGRMTPFGPAGMAPPAYSLRTYTHHVTGWNADYLDGSRTQRVFEIVIMNANPGVTGYDDRRERHHPKPDRVATLRLDRSTATGLVSGRLKVFGWPKFVGTDPMRPEHRGPDFVQRLGEEIEYDLTDVRWEGDRVEFTRQSVAWAERYRGEITGRWIRGEYTRNGARATAGEAWRGVRARVLGYGLEPKSEVERTDWQERTRAQLEHLLQGRAEVRATRFHVGGSASQVPALRIEADDVPVRDRRDDYRPSSASRVGAREPIDRAQVRGYVLREVHFEFDLALDGDPARRHTRRVHGFLTVPDAPAPPTGYPVAVILNGHAGSAFNTLQPGEGSWAANADRFGPRSAGETGSGCRLVPLMDVRCPEIDRPNEVADHGEYYGDAFARRGYVVLSIDLSHRGWRPTPFVNTSCSTEADGEIHRFIHQSPFDRYPVAPGQPERDEARYYNSERDWNGDDAPNGNALHPWIIPDEFADGQTADRWPTFTSDWTEDGERVWDVRSALTVLLGEAMNPTTQLNGGRPLLLNREFTVIAGLSLGAEITTLTAALDTRLKVAVPAGWSPDTGLFAQSTANHPCGQWVYADFAEYLDTSDDHALIAPRGLVVQTQTLDNTYHYTYPAAEGLPVRPITAADKEVARRSRLAYAGTPERFIHFVHQFTPLRPYATHSFAFQYVRTPRQIGPDPAEPDLRTRITWQSDESEVPVWLADGQFGIGQPVVRYNLFEVIRRLLRARPAVTNPPLRVKDLVIDKAADFKDPKEHYEGFDPAWVKTLPAALKGAAPPAKQGPVGHAFIRLDERPILQRFTPRASEPKHASCEGSCAAADACCGDGAEVAPKRAHGALG